MSLTKITQGTPPQLTWYDLVNPKEVEVKDFAKQFQLPTSSVKDCLDPKHLPKYENLGNNHFVILRAYDEKCADDADSVQDLTRKLAIFIGPDYVLSVHRKDQPFLNALRIQWDMPNLFSPGQSIREAFLVDLFNAILLTYDAPIEKAYQALEDLEGKSFLKEAELQSLIQEAYYLKRQLNVVKRVLRLTLDVMNHLHQTEIVKRTITQDLKENAEKLLFASDDILDNVNTLLSLYISLQSHKTNEIMRVLTVMSVIVLPLNLIAGIYGMNFKMMPELEWSWGYPMALFLMTAIGVGIFRFSKKKGWM